MEFAPQACEALLRDLKDSILVTDSAMLEVLQWTLKGGLNAVFAGGSIVIKNIDDPMAVDSQLSEQPSIVFLLSSHIARYAPMIQTHLLARSYHECRIVMATAESLHVAELDMEPDLQGSFDAYLGFSEGYFAKVESKVHEWMVSSARKHDTDPDDDEFEVVVEYAPICFATVTPEFFMIPVVESMFPSLTGAVAMTKTQEAPVAFDKQTRQLAFSLCSLLESLGAKEEIFAAGPTSRQVAKCIISQSAEAPRRAITTNNIGLILMDRTLDLTPPTSHPDNLLDTIFRFLQRPSPNSLDREISPSALSSTFPFPYTLSHGGDTETMDYLRVLTMLSQKDSLVATRKRIVDLIAKVQPSARPRVLGRLSMDQLDKLLSIFKDDEEALVNDGSLLNAISGAIESVKLSESSNSESLQNIEKLIALSLAESSDPACAILPIIDILQNISNSLPRVQSISSPSSPPNSTKPLTTRQPHTIMDALKLATFSYSMLGPDAIRSMDPSLRNRLGAGFLHALEATQKGISSSSNPEVNQIWVTEVLERLDMIGGMRAGFKQKSPIDPDSVFPYHPLIRTLLQTSLSTESTGSPSIKTTALTELDDLAHIPYSGTLGTVLNKFSRLLGGAHPTPREYSTLIVFVIGGTTASEVREIREVAREFGVTVLVGSTGMCDADVLMQMVFPGVPGGLLG
ncbi:Sec1 domain-containing protein 2 [Podochytrium sp. JEL0797]|nr:Sec1 domain-containing protein 2 [Podochytrium sp. JEL0797]